MDKSQLHNVVSRDKVLQSSSAVIKKLTWWGLAINILLSAAKMTVGILGHSQALLADGFHSLSDTTSDVAILVGVRFWSTPADKRHPYGHGRIETIVSLFIGVFLFVVACVLGIRAIVSFTEEHEQSPDWLAFIVAVVSIIVKEFLYQINVRKGRKLRSSALIANAWHHRSDSFSSLPVAIAVLVCIIWPSLDFVDHIAAMVVSAILLKVAWDICYRAFEQLIDAGLDIKTAETLAAVASELPQVREVHKFRSRHIGSGVQVDLHVLVDGSLTVSTGHDIAMDVKQKLMSKDPEIVDVLVHIEPAEI